MIFQQAWNRFTSDWKSFALMALWPALGAIAMFLVMGLVGFLTLGSSIMSLVRMGPGANPADMFAFMGSILLFYALVLVIGVLGGGLVYAGFLGSLVAYRRGEPVDFSTFWSYATRYYGRFLLLGLLSMLISIGIGLLSIPVMIIPLIGALAVMFVNLLVSLYITIYPAYLIINDDMSAIDAIGVGFRVLFRGFGEAALGSLMLVPLSLMGVVSFVLLFIPILGWIAIPWVMLLLWGLIFYYYMERFETNVRHFIHY